MTPQLDPKTRLPYTFMSIPTEEHVALYQRGIERVVKVDPYAGLLVSMHCAGLYDRARATLPGFSAKYIKSGESRMVSEFLDHLKLRQMRIKSDLRTNPAMSGLVEEASLDRRARLLGGAGPIVALLLPRARRRIRRWRGYRSTTAAGKSIARSATRATTWCPSILTRSGETRWR